MSPKIPSIQQLMSKKQTSDFYYIFAKPLNNSMKNSALYKLVKPFLLILVLAFITSCASREKIVYLQGDESTFEQVSNYIPTLQPDDQLVITISAIDAESILPFNQANNYPQGPLEQRQVYLIDENGEINYPVLGKVKLAGLTRIEAVDFLKVKLKEYIKDPGVNIVITNFKVTVLGEVARPGAFSLNHERITILEALGLAGDLTINGVRDNVMVVRETAGNKEFIRIDLTKNEMVNSPAYYLKQNDVVYVEPNKAQIQSSSFGRNTSIIISVAGLLITVISVLTR